MSVPRNFSVGSTYESGVGGSGGSPFPLDLFGNAVAGFTPGISFDQDPGVGENFTGNETNSGTETGNGTSTVDEGDESGSGLSQEELNEGFRGLIAAHLALEHARLAARIAGISDSISPSSGDRGRGSGGDVADPVNNVVPLHTDVESVSRVSQTHVPEINNVISIEGLNDLLQDGDLVFGWRPLALPGFGDFSLENVRPAGIGRTGSLADRLNLEPLHQQVFYKENGRIQNIGFFGDNGGIVDSDVNFPRNFNSYIFETTIYRNVDTRTIDFTAGSFDGRYNLISNNCQVYCDFIKTRVFLRSQLSQ